MPEAYELRTSRDSGPEMATVIFHGAPSAEDWGSLEELVAARLHEGVIEWHFDLRPLRFCDSHGLGMWLRLNGLIRQVRGRAVFFLTDPSRMLDLFRMTKLDQVLLVEARSGGDDAKPPGRPQP